MVIARIVLIILLSITANTAHACGWWGDNEMSSRRNAAALTADGKTVEQTLSRNSMKLPGRMGYGIAVPEPGRAIPYLIATNGQPLVRIRDLQVFGFHSVIDLGTPAHEAHLHRIETEAVGMRYFSIPVVDASPTEVQIRKFKEVVLNSNNAPLLIYAAKQSLIAVMWASYRLSFGSPLGFVLNEGRAMGLTREQEMDLETQIQR
jgi:hypothetical protein